MLDDRAVSDTLGFVIIFALIISVVGLTFALGYSGLQDTRDFERLNNAERAFDVMGDNFDDIVRRGAPSRATEVKVAEAQIRLADPTRVNVTVTPTTGPSAGVTEGFDFQSNPIVYATGNGRRIVYSNGAIFREGQSGAVVVRHTEVTATEEHVLVPLITTRATGDTTAVGGTSTVLVRAKQPKGQLESFDFSAAETAESYDVTVRVTSPRPNVWEEELDRQENLSCSVSGQTVTCTTDDPTERVYVQQTFIDISFD